MEKESDAKAAVEHLKRNKAGRATFLPVETVSGRLADTERVKGCAGYIGVASELAAYDPKYQGVIRELLGRTVLAETMDAALAIARAGGYRLKIVTLDGQVVSPGGSITGGSAAKRVGVFSRSADIESLSAQIKEINAAILREETEKRKYTSSAEALRAKLRENEEARASQSAEREARSARPPRGAGPSGRGTRGLRGAFGRARRQRRLARTGARPAGRARRLARRGRRGACALRA